MKLGQLKKLVDEAVVELVGSGISSDDVEVKISVSEPSNGRRGSVNIRGAYLGVDFERGEFRIDPKESIRKM